MLTSLDFNRLKVFYVIYKSQNITHAARELNVTRSALSQALSKLEKTLNVKLFTRTQKNVLPTEWADFLYAHVEQFVLGIDETLLSISNGKNEIVGHLKMGAPPEFGSNHLIKVIRDFNEKHPGVSFELEFGTPAPLCEKLISNKLDFAFIDAANVFSKLYPIQTKLIMREEEVLCCSKQYFDKHRSSIMDHRLISNLTFLSHVPQGTDIKFWYKHHYKKVPNNLKVGITVDDVRALKQATLEGCGISFMPLRLIEEEIKNRQLFIIPTKTPNYINQISLAWTSNKDFTKSAKAFMKHYNDNFSE